MVHVYFMLTTHDHLHFTVNWLNLHSLSKLRCSASVSDACRLSVRVSGLGLTRTSPANYKQLHNSTCPPAEAPWLFPGLKAAVFSAANGNVHYHKLDVHLFLDNPGEVLLSNGVKHFVSTARGQKSQEWPLMFNGTIPQQITRAGISVFTSVHARL